MPHSKPVDHLRSILVATGALPTRDEHLVRLEHWITTTLDQRDNRDDKELLHRYAAWHLLRRLRHRNHGRPATYHQFTAARQRVRAAIALLDWLHARGLTLAACRQADIDAWLSGSDATHLAEAGQFVRWAIAQRIVRGTDYPAVKWPGPARPLDHDQRWEHAKRLLHDDSLKPEDRVAGLLVLLYAQWPSTISQLTIDDIDTTEDQVRLRLGQTPITLPEPLATLTTELLTSRRGHAVLGERGTAPWLFPGGQPGRPISSYALSQRLRRLGIRLAETRSTALFQLATELPAAILARTLGIHIDVAGAWQKHSSGDWTTYAADVSRRNQADVMTTDPGPRSDDDTHDIIDDALTELAARRAAWLGDDLTVIALLASLIDQAERCLPHYVCTARENGHSGLEIAQILATSPEEARLRFDPESPIADTRWPYDT